MLYNSSWKFCQLAAGQLLSGQPVRYRKGRRYRPVHHVQNRTCRVTLTQPPRRSPCWASPLAFGLIGRRYLPVYIQYSRMRYMEYKLGKYCRLEMVHLLARVTGCLLPPPLPLCGAKAGREMFEGVKCSPPPQWDRRAIQPNHNKFMAKQRSCVEVNSFYKRMCGPFS